MAISEQPIARLLRARTLALARTPILAWPLAAALILSACSSGSNEPSTPPPEPAPAEDSQPAAALPRVVLDGAGLALISADTAAAKTLAFGAAKADTIAALAARGAPALSQNGECGAGPLEFAQWADGLQLVFQGGKFAGWSIDGRAADAAQLRTAKGIGIGAPRAALSAAYPGTRVEQSTLGNEFSAGGLSGLLTDATAAATVSHLWAGVDCSFR